MSAVPTDVLSERTFANEALDSGRTDSKFSLAMDAVTKDKSHAGQSVRAYLDTLLEVLNGFPAAQSGEGVLDARILSTIDASKDSINQFRNLAVVVSESKTASDFSPHLIAFLEGVLGIKKHYKISDNAAYLWRDAFSFICREIFVSTVAALLANGCWRAVRDILEHRYKGAENGELDYCAFDGFQRSIDVFRNRRLKLRRASITSDVLRERIKESALTFEHVMQADFVLHVYSLFQYSSPLRTWHARTLGSADEQMRTGFDMFVDIRAGKTAEGLTLLFDTSDWSQFSSKLGASVSRSALHAPDPLDYAGFIATNNVLFNH